MALKPFYPLEVFEDGSYKQILQEKLVNTLQKEGCEKAAHCPEGESKDQWVAVHMNYFFNDINLYFGAIQEKCTNFTCPTMAAGVKFEYLLVDKYKHASPSRVPAKRYVDNLFNWTVGMLRDTTLFPPNKDSPFPPNSVERVKNMARRYFRVYAHIYYSHLDTLQEQKLDTVFYDSLRYYLTFVDMYSLVSIVDLRPLSSVIIKLVPTLRSFTMNRLLYIVSQQLKESEETKKHLDTSSSNVQGPLPVIKDDEGEKIDWNEVLQQGVECGPASQEGETEGDENCICTVM